MQLDANWILVLLVPCIIFVVFVLRKHLDRKQVKDTDATPSPETCDTEACGVNCFCDDEALRRRMSHEIVYFEDEELDRFRGVASDAYSDADVEEFSYVLTTLRKDEVAAWLDSLEKRGIALPDALKDEAIIMLEG